MSLELAAPPVVLMPVYNDWPLIAPLLARLDAALSGAGVAADVVLVDDGSSTSPTRELLPGAQYSAIRTVTVVQLSRNGGHQRALAIGLAWVDHRHGSRTVVVMDADGEDAPEDVPRLLAAHQRDGGKVMFASRSRRSESLVFRTCYALYRLTHRLLTGTGISFGNFSVVPAAVLPRLVLLAELWNNYPSAVVKARIAYATIPIPRASRLGGESKMNLTALVLHGLGSFAVHGDVIGTRAVLASLVAVFVCLVGIAVVVGIRVFTDLAIPGWASAVVGLLVAILMQTVMLSLGFVFVTLNSRNYAAIVPRRAFGDYVVGEELFYP